MASPAFNKYDLISEENLILIDIIINCACLNIFAMFGIVGNILNVIILRKQGLRDSTNLTLMSLSVVDLAYGVVMPVRRAQCVVSKFDVILAQNFDVFINVYLVIPARILSFISSGHIVLISLERTVAVYFPIKAASLLTMPRTVLCLVLIYLFWLILMSPFAQIFAVDTFLNSESNKTFYMITFSAFLVDNWEVINIINVFVLANIRGPVSFSIIALASVAIGYKLHEARVKRQEMTSWKSKASFDTKVARMLLVVCLVYLALAFPSNIPTLMYFIDDTFVMYQGRTTSMFTVSEYLVDLLYVVNSAVNFLIYVTMSRKFHRTYKSLVRGCQKMFSQT
ncbi:FMRFamide receptor [Biomphalaria glabrata]|nr:FMRFamide receptor [Biomphalaria glabrata]